MTEQKDSDFTRVPREESSKVDVEIGRTLFLVSKTPKVLCENVEDDLRFSNFQQQTWQRNIFRKPPLVRQWQLVLRIIFSAIFLLTLCYFNIRYKAREKYLYSTECKRDYTFEWTSWANSWLGKNHWFLFPFMGYCGYLMDFQLISLAFVWFFKLNTGRYIFAFFLFYSTRNLV